MVIFRSQKWSASKNVYGTLCHSNGLGRPPQIPLLRGLVGQDWPPPPPSLQNDKIGFRSIRLNSSLLTEGSFLRDLEVNSLVITRWAGGRTGGGSLPVTHAFESQPSVYNLHVN